MIPSVLPPSPIAPEKVTAGLPVPVVSMVNVRLPPESVTGPVNVRLLSLLERLERNVVSPVALTALPTVRAAPVVARRPPPARTSVPAPKAPLVGDPAGPTESAPTTVCEPTWSVTPPELVLPPENTTSPVPEATVSGPAPETFPKRNQIAALAPELRSVPPPAPSEIGWFIDSLPALVPV
jgi:hypothetical protein